MAQTVRDVMTPEPITLSQTSTVAEAAKAMRDSHVGNVVVRTDDRKLCGIVTDRDIVIRAIAEKKNPDQTKLEEICSKELVTVRVDQPLDQVIDIMRTKALRRIIVVDGNEPVGVVSIGDLAVDRDPSSVLGQISSARPNI